MFTRNRSRFMSRMRCAVTCLLVTAMLLPALPAWAGLNQLRNNSVGGISVDVTGVLGAPSVEGAENLRKVRIGKTERIPAGLVTQTRLRKVSLRGLEAAIEAALRNSISGNPFDLPEAVRYLGGLQRIEFVLVYPDKNDIVLAGPGESWKVDKAGNIVGATTERPVLLLEDLIVALREVRTSRGTGISCSIDPTAEGRRNLQSFLSSQRQFSRSVKEGVEKSLGMQKISVTGVSPESHLARVMVASDYRMKRIAMHHDRSPVAGLPSFIDLLQSTRGLSKDMMPRWWLACNYRPLAKADDGLAWQLRGPGVKAMTENDFISETGDVRSGAGKNPLAQKWADMMTEKYEDLSVKYPVFGQLRNVMDMCVVAALIEKERLIERADASLPLLTNPQSKFHFEAMHVPKQVPSQCSTVKKGREWIITASGGVDVDVWSVLDNVEADPTVGQIHASSAATQTAEWWWN